MITAATAAVTRVSLVDALAWGEAEWDALVRHSRVPSPFMRWAWHQAWVQSAALSEVRESFALVLRTGDILQAVMPFKVRPLAFRRATTSALTWAIDSAGCPDHLDLLAAPGTQLDAVVPLLEALPWNTMLLDGVAEDASNLTRLTELLAQRGHRVVSRELDSCPYLELPASWEEYLATLTPRRRQTIRRKERKLLREHAATVTDYAPDRLEEGWRLLRTLHEWRWAGSGAFADPAVEQLLRRFSRHVAERGELWLASLDLDGQPAAAWYGFAWGDTVFFYQGGRDPRWKSESVGSVLMGMMIRRAIERGYRRFDFLRGRDPYKLKWTSTERRIYQVAVFRSSWSGRWLRALDFAARLRARMRRRREYASAG